MAVQRFKRISKLMFALVGAVCVLCLATANAKPVPKTKFWNITGETIVKLELASPGTTKWGANLCTDDDGVDDDERLVLKDVATGTYDVRLTYKDNGVCLAKGIKIEDGKIFSIEKNQLTNCTKPR